MEEMETDERSNRITQQREIQLNTFTRWCNHHLSQVNESIPDLETGFQDGLKLVSLLQVLSKKEIPAKIFRKPKFLVQKVFNIDACLAFMSVDEGMVFRNIEARDLTQGNIRYIEALVWVIILKYHFTLPQDGTRAGLEVRLLDWVKSRLPSELQHISTFDCTEWKNGVALSALVNTFCPSSYLPQWSDIDPCEGVCNTRRAMGVAQKWLGVPGVLSPEEMCCPNVSKQSIFVYVAFFIGAQVVKEDIGPDAEDDIRRGVKRSAPEAALELPDEDDGKKMVK